MGDSTFVMVNGPSHFRANFRLEIDCLRFLASSQTLSPLAKGLKLQQVREDMTWRVSSWVARASSHAALRVFRWVSTMRIEESEIKEGRAWGS